MKRWPASTKLQTIIFDRDRWSPTKARTWLLKHNKKAPATVYKPEYLHYRQKPPFMFQAGTFRTITLDKKRGIKAISALPREENPGNPKKKGVKKTMAAKTKALAKTTAGKTTKKKRRHNPGLIGGINVGGAVKDLIPLFCGALICKFSAKRFAEGGGEYTNWTWKNYALGFAATTVAAMISAAVFRGKYRVTQNVFLGGMLLFFYKLFVNEIAPKSEWLTSWFGDSEDIYPDMSEDVDYNEPGDIYQADDGNDVVYGADNLYRPVSEMHRAPAVAPPQADMGVEISDRDPTFGVEIEPPDPYFGQPNLIDAYNTAYQTW